MPRFVSKDGKHVVETSLPRERVELLAQGYKEQKARTEEVQEADGKQSKKK